MKIKVELGTLENYQDIAYLTGSFTELIRHLNSEYNEYFDLQRYIEELVIQLFPGKDYVNITCLEATDEVEMVENELRVTVKFDYWVM